MKTRLKLDVESLDVASFATADADAPVLGVLIWWPFGTGGGFGGGGSGSEW